MAAGSPDNLLKQARKLPITACGVKNEFPSEQLNFAVNRGRAGDKRLKWLKMVGRVGFEPTTNGLKGRCSTTELPTRKSLAGGKTSGWEAAPETRAESSACEG